MAALYHTAWRFVCRWYPVVVIIFIPGTLKTEAETVKEIEELCPLRKLIGYFSFATQCLRKMREAMVAVIQNAGIALVSFVYRFVIKTTNMFPGLVLGSGSRICNPKTKRIPQDSNSIGFQFLLHITLLFAHEKNCKLWYRDPCHVCPIEFLTHRDVHAPFLLVTSKKTGGSDITLWFVD